MYLTTTIGFALAIVTLALWLRRAQAELRTVADHAPSAIAHVVGHGDRLKYRFVNKKYAALYGTQPSDVIGKHPKDVLGPNVFARSYPNMSRAIAGETVTFDLDLGEKTVEVVYYPDMPHPGMAQGFVGVITDVSELRRLQRKTGQELK
ncbi:MAG: PAS domain-containing protein [Hyphomicrobiaceae bacterium]|nr:PAS domain-containing protein [Hyphomicrobiaceae bacterium]